MSAAPVIESADQAAPDAVAQQGAPIRHVDHIDRHVDGGPTTPGNGRGVCERGNYVREMPGWTVRLVDPDTHLVVTTTPTGHQYVSNPPEPP